jgi:integrase
MAHPIAGLYRRGRIWHIDCQVLGVRICASTGTSDLAQARLVLARAIDDLRMAKIYGTRPDRTFADAAAHYVETSSGMRSLERNVQDLRLILPYIGDLPLRHVHSESLRKFIRDRTLEGRSPGTINRTLAVVRRVLNLAARQWRDEHGLTWLETAPMISLLADHDRRQPYPLDVPEEALLGAMLPPHLRLMARFATNTGCREQEVCQLRWTWEVPLSSLGRSVFIIPAQHAKNGRERVVIPNRFAMQAVERSRGVHPERVFTFRGQPMTKIYNSAWKRARTEAASAYESRLGRRCPEGFARIRVHDLRHTFGYRLRAVGVSLEDRELLLGHRGRSITTHYSMPELPPLIDAVDKICRLGSRKNPAMPVLRIRDVAKSLKDGGKGGTRTLDLSIMSAAL